MNMLPWFQYELCKLGRHSLLRPVITPWNSRRHRTKGRNEKLSRLCSTDKRTGYGMFRSNHTAVSVRIHDARRQWLGSVSKSMKKRQPEVLLLRYRKRTSLSVFCLSCVFSNHRLFGPVIGDFRIETPPISWLSDGRVILITEKGGLHAFSTATDAESISNAIPRLWYTLSDRFHASNAAIVKS